MNQQTVTKVEVFCPHCQEALGLQFVWPIVYTPWSVYPRFDRTIENGVSDD